MRVVGGKPDASGRREAVIVWTVPGGPADLAGLQQGDKVCTGFYILERGEASKVDSIYHAHEILLLLH